MENGNLSNTWARRLPAGESHFYESAMDNQEADTKADLVRFRVASKRSTAHPDYPVYSAQNASTLDSEGQFSWISDSQFFNWC